ncbi:uncharacterized protein PFB0145c isoform X2 [Teleopsis dalmanni]|uniref:uncharacterized protein PFB0145c isoform X2 n=1 Tax=Teleopsis dalmanni TaxID=139649 RepID=UPI0018CD3E2A|nr:uncharacterized protein PFB0145c isoform X2 [Teleopsis dalmanni]
MIDDVIGCSSDYKGVNIIERFEKLNKWQEEQKCLLQERQSKQRELLEMEQKTIYQMMGLMCGDRGLENGSDKVCEENSGELNPGKQFGRTMHEVFEKILNTSENVEIAESKVQRRPFLKKGEGIKSRFKVDPETFRIDKLPSYKYAKKKKSSLKKRENCSNSTSNVKENVLERLDEDGKCFQHQLICSKSALKLTSKLDAKSSLSTGKMNPEKYDSEYEFERHSSAENLNSSICSDTKLKQPISWAKVLDSQNIQPVSLKQIRPKNIFNETGQDDSTLSIFELIEKKCDEGPIDMNYTPIKRFLKNRVCYRVQEQDEIPVSDKMKNVGISPEIDKSPNKDDSDQEDTNDYMDVSSLCIPINVVNKGSGVKHNQQVRFADEIDNSTVYSNQSETSNLIENDLFKQQDIFKKFQEALIFTINNQTEKYNESVDNTIPPISSDPLIKELQEKTLLVKTHLEELEKEIDTFKTNNKELIKAKQDLEQERNQLHEEQAELLERIKDEKIQLEIYLHDERMKIEEDKRKFEEKIRMQKSSTFSKDRKEISRMKQEIEDMKVQMKQKDQDHTAAQSRMRAQVRNLDREQRQLMEEIDRLNKENKKLQNENLRLNNDSNKKMLQEINKNIAKLTPKMSTNNEESYGRQKETKVNTAAPPRNITNKSLQQKSHKQVITNTQVKLSDQSATGISLESNENVDPKITYPSSGIPLIEGHNLIKKDSQSISQNNGDIKREIVNADGSRDILYPNGNVKKVSANGLLTRMLYYNKDIKETDINQGTVRYYYAETNTWHTTYLDGLEILEFPNGQTEHRRKNGVVEIHFPNNSIKIINPLDEKNLEEWRFVDGTNLIKLRNGDKVIALPNGQKEIHTKLNKRREYPDGTVKLIYPDGRQETRYSNGRIRLKDKDGNLIMDSGVC